MAAVRRKRPRGGAFRQENIHFRTAELGYYLSEECWGKGIMTDAVRQLCEKIFSQTNIIRIFAEPFSHNIGSRRVLEKAGFQLEGILKNFVSKDGKIYDAAMYALTKLPFEIRALADNERERALKLAFDVFSGYEAPEYSAEGVEEFKAAPHNYRLTPFSFPRLHIFRHIAQKFLEIHQVLLRHF